jgi:ribosomal protein S12 methylthiotransferase accessory factor YcaO
VYNEVYNAVEELVAQVVDLTARMDALAGTLPAVRAALTQFDDALLGIGPAAAKAAGIRDHEAMEAEVTEAISGRFDAARLRLLAALQ